MTSATMLRHLNSDHTTYLTPCTDATQKALGAVLQQRLYDIITLIAFFCKHLSPAYERHSNFGLKLLAT